MKKALSATLILLASALVASFSTISGDEEKIRVVVTAAKPTLFDLSHNDRVGKGLRTPYEFTIDAAESHFIFRSRNMKVPLKVEFHRGGGGVTGEWPLVVVLVQKNSMTTFGMD